MKITNYISVLTLSLMITSVSGFAQKSTINTLSIEQLEKIQQEISQILSKKSP